MQVVKDGFKIEACYHVLPFRDLLVLQCLGAAAKVEVKIVQANLS